MLTRRLLALLITIFLILAAFPDHTHATHQPPSISEVLLTVREDTSISRANEVVRSGIPIPRALNLLDTTTLAIINTTTNTPLPAEFEVLARWNAGLNDINAPIRWLLVTFPASVGTGQTSTYRLVFDGSAGANPLPENPLTVTQNGDQIIVNTGAATFTLGTNVAALFDEISLPDGTRLVSGGTMTATTGGTTYAHSPQKRALTIEYAGPLMAVIALEGTYEMPAVGNGELSTLRRYEFRWNSPTAIIRQAVNWEGAFCTNGVITCESGIDAILLEQVRDQLTVETSGETSVIISDTFGITASQIIEPDQPSHLRQLRRLDRFAAPAYEMVLPENDTTGLLADGAFLALSSHQGTVTIALDHMHRYEPQALRHLSDGSLAIDLVDDGIYLGKRQGMFATMAVSVSPNYLPDGGEIRADTWALLNHPLHAWPDAAWFNASGAVDEVPVGELPADLAALDEHIQAVLLASVAPVDDYSLHGLMTFGLYPRTWHDPIRSDELDCGDADPTPIAAWDNAYWCGTWTDYHNTLATATRWAIRSGETSWLEELAFPGALRMLHTQIYQCGPQTEDFYCGQAPAGYGGYRFDSNGSHAYFENLFLYYWLTGDKTVVNTLQRGANSMRDYLCPGRRDGIGAPCPPDQPRADFWAGLTGRAAMQWVETFLFVGLTSQDATYLDDWRSILARAVTLNYVEATQNGRNYGFWLPTFDFENGLEVWPPRPLTPGTYSNDQLWMVSLYDMHSLYHYMLETNDEPLGNPALAPSRILIAWANTLVDFGATLDPGTDGWPPADGTVQGSWPNALTFTWQGERIGGTLVDVQANLAGDDPHIYNAGKSTMTALLMRAGQLSGDTRILEMAQALVRFSISAAAQEFMPLGKVQGEFLARLPMAVARMANSSGQ